MTNTGRMIGRFHEKDCKKIYDDFYGLITLTPDEIKLIDSPIFQRLRNIKQLGLASFVFPGGIHNRFSHSLGVLSIIHRLTSHLSFFDDKPEEVVKLRIAALLHDIGHLPLSHTIESVYRYEEKEQKAGVEPRRIGEEGEESPIRELEGPKQPPTAVFHERLSKRVIENTRFDDGITNLLESLDFEPEEIGNIVVSAIPHPYSTSS